MTQNFTTHNGKLTLGGIDATELAKQYSTPLYVMEENKIVSAMQEYTSAFEKFYPGDFEVCYANKAFCCKEMFRLCMREGLYADVVSGGELYTAKSVGFPLEKIRFHGNNKTVDELKTAISDGVGLIIVDNLTELYRIEEISKELGKITPVSLRIKPGVEAHTHEYVKTGGIDSKFGLALENGEAMAAVESVLGCENVSLISLNSHIGSQIFDAEPFADSAVIMLGFMAKIRARFGVDISLLNLGGGIGIVYTDDDTPITITQHVESICKTVVSECAALGIPLPKIGVEPGRSIVACAGTTLYTVGSVKEIAGIRNYVMVDGGLTDNPRYSLYGAKYTVITADKAETNADYKATIAGRCCETDLLAERILIQKPDVGDIVAFLGTGAYNYSMSSNYNRVARPAVVFVKDGQSRVVVRREAAEDLCALDV